MTVSDTEISAPAALNADLGRAPDLYSRLSVWLGQQGIDPGITGRLIETLGEDKASAWLGDGTGCRQLRDVARGLADLNALTDAELAALDYFHGHGPKPPKSRRRRNA
jgi:hypothetical protein